MADEKEAPVKKVNKQPKTGKKTRSDLQRNKVYLRKLRRVAQSSGSKAAEEYSEKRAVELVGFRPEVKKLAEKYNFKVK